MRRRLTGRLLAAASLVVLLGTACTPDAATQPTPSPTPAVASPPETAQEREQRLAYTAAEKSYRTFREEYNRVLRNGGASKPTSTMLATAGGPYLKEAVEGVEAYNGLHYQDVGIEKILFVHPDGYSPSEVLLNTCEDSRAVKIVRADGKSVGQGELRRISLRVRFVSGVWRAWDGTGEKVKSCDP